MSSDFQNKLGDEEPASSQRSPLVALSHQAFPVQPELNSSQGGQERQMQPSQLPMQQQLQQTPKQRRLTNQSPQADLMLARSPQVQTAPPTAQPVLTEQMPSQNSIIYPLLGPSTPQNIQAMRAKLHRRIQTMSDAQVSDLILQSRLNKQQRNFLTQHSQQQYQHLQQGQQGQQGQQDQEQQQGVHHTVIRTQQKMPIITEKPEPQNLSQKQQPLQPARHPLQLPQHPDALTSQESRQLNMEAQKMMGCTPEKDLVRIKGSLSKMSQRQREVLEKQGIDPLLYFFRNATFKDFVLRKAEPQFSMQQQGQRMEDVMRGTPTPERSIPKPLIGQQQSHPTRCAKMAEIRKRVVDALPAGCLTTHSRNFQASFFVQWDLLGFMNDQYNNGASKALGLAITLSGSARYAHATTCAEYVRRNWPLRGPPLLSGLQAAIDNPSHLSHVRFADFEVRINLAKPVCINVRGSTQAIVEVAQQVAWIGAAFRASNNEQIQYSEATVQQIWRDEGLVPAAFGIAFQLVPLLEEEQNCWYALFNNPVIARGFPVPYRENNEVGLEIPLEIMAALGGARHAIDFEGGLVLKGFSTMFVPVKLHKDCVQWHFLHNHDNSRLSFREVRIRCPFRAALGEVSHELLRSTRAILGWWRAAETHLGTADANYDELGWSAGKDIDQSAGFSDIAFDFSYMSNWGLPFVVGSKDTKLHASREGSFQTIVQYAESTPVVLYDVGGGRGWLVPALNVMHHIAHTRHHRIPYKEGEQVVPLAPVDPAWETCAARGAVKQNESLKLFSFGPGKDYYFKDLFLDIWSLLERLLDKSVEMRAVSGSEMSGATQVSLYGWEYMTLVEERPFRRKEQTIKETSGGWTGLIRNIDAVVLFGSGFGDIIKPVSDPDGPCQKWKSLPRGMDFLAALVPLLNMLCLKAQPCLTREYLDVRCERGSEPFGKCSDNKPSCNCDRLQQVFHEPVSNFRGRTSSGLQGNGCVIFGKTQEAKYTNITIQRGLKAINTNTNLSNPVPHRGSPRPNPSTDHKHRLSPPHLESGSTTPDPSEASNKSEPEDLKGPCEPVNQGNDCQIEQLPPLEEHRREPDDQESSLSQGGGQGDIQQEQLPLEDPHHHIQAASEPCDDSSIAEKPPGYTTYSDIEPRASPIQASRSLRRTPKFENHRPSQDCVCAACPSAPSRSPRPERCPEDPVENEEVDVT